MGGGQGSSSGSWYASVGGKARVDFSGPLEKEALGPLGKERVGQTMSLDSGGWRSAVFPFEPTLSQARRVRDARMPCVWHPDAASRELFVAAIEGAYLGGGACWHARTATATQQSAALGGSPRSPCPARHLPI